MYGESMSSLAQRLDMALLNSPERIEQQVLAEAIGKRRNWITDVKAGTRKPGEAMKKAAQILGVPEEWLIHGTGPAPEWAPKVIPEHESLQKSMDLLVKMFAEQQAELKALRQEIQDLKPKRPPETESQKCGKKPRFVEPETILANVE